MRKYKLVPTWWYLALLAITIAFAFVSALAYPTGMAWYSVVLSLVIATLFTSPIGIIQAFTNMYVPESGDSGFHRGDMLTSIQSIGT